MPKITNQPKRNSPLIWLLLLIVILAVAGGIYYFIPVKNQRIIPTSTSVEVSNSNESSALEKELNDTDLGTFETDLNQLDADASQL